MEDKYKYKIETHAHTSECSPCGRITGTELVKIYKDAGYSGINITDHFMSCVFDMNDNPDKILQKYYSGYLNALHEGEKLGVKVYRGIEIRLNESINEYLLYGVTYEFLKKALSRLDNTLEEFYRFCSDENVLLYQAHPYRNGIVPMPPEFLDGIEVFNSHPGHESRNEKALEYARKYNLPEISGSDVHEIPHACRSGIMSSYVPENDREFYELIKSRDYKMITF